MAICLKRESGLRHLALKILPIENKFFQEDSVFACMHGISSLAPEIFIGEVIKEVYDPKTKKKFFILNPSKDPIAIDETEGVLSNFSRKLEEEGIKPIDLIKKAWKSSE